METKTIEWNEEVKKELSEILQDISPELYCEVIDFLESKLNNHAQVIEIIDKIFQERK